jgi:hypothetical protein
MLALLFPRGEGTNGGGGGRQAPAVNDDVFLDIPPALVLTGSPSLPST